MTDDTTASQPDAMSGYDLARAALEEARALAKAQGKSVGMGRSAPIRTKRRTGDRSRRRWSGSGPDSRDPQPLGRMVGKVAQQHGWESRISEGTLFGMWPQIVGEDIATHADPTRLEGTVLHVRAESTAWATQLRYMQSQIIAKIAKVIGHGMVTSLRITGPQAPSWRKGPRHISGRGPRDTYG
ncbi:DUF721 family protein [Gordonia neofelifaecis]|uniref:UPF0232 protein SCNU_13308 n=1 Tax=Gordonia neofelifaecis NRRL B-59395 TaxID=644548 RepID=F1YLA2_9ACTN|nr:DUF721 family protein [Gordonia neofelifaecis]EGD54562.1 hypothetical protein SCNU_13308 [Gordonia neofelifaecis NRRL B-59395]